MYASPLNKGSFINQLDTAILSALEIDTDYHVNVITGSDGVIRGAAGGHPDTSMACQMSLVIAPLVRGRIPTIVDKVNTVVTPGSSIDVVVTEFERKSIWDRRDTRTDQLWRKDCCFGRI